MYEHDIYQKHRVSRFVVLYYTTLSNAFLKWFLFVILPFGSYEKVMCYPFCDKLWKQNRMRNTPSNQNQETKRPEKHWIWSIRLPTEITSEIVEYLEYLELPYDTFHILQIGVKKQKIVWLEDMFKSLKSTRMISIYHKTYHVMVPPKKIWVCTSCKKEHYMRCCHRVKGRVDDPNERMVCIKCYKFLNCEVSLERQKQKLLIPTYFGAETSMRLLTQEINEHFDLTSTVVRTMTAYQSIDSEWTQSLVTVDATNINSLFPMPLDKHVYIKIEL